MPVALGLAGRHPAGRAPATGRLGLVQAFLNSDEAVDAAAGVSWSDARAYARHHIARGVGGAGPDDADLARAIELREALRALALGNHDHGPAREAEAVLAGLAPAVAPYAGLPPRFAGVDRRNVTASGPGAPLVLVLRVVFAA